MFPVDHEGLLFHKHQKKSTTIKKPSNNHENTIKNPSTSYV
jgi:hypothetical protein